MSDIHIKIDNEEKKAAERVFKDLDLTLSQAVRLFLKQSVAVNGLPFEVKYQAKPTPNEDK